MATKSWLIICIALSIPLFQIEASAKKGEWKGQRFEAKRKEELPPHVLHDRGADLIAISPCTSKVVFEAAHFQPEASYHGPGGEQATISITARSPLPLWGVCVEPPVLQGPAGDLPPDRIWVRSEATENDFYPLEQPVPILFGGAKEGPDRQVTLELQLRPAWQDRPGQYRGHIVVRPFLPGGESLRSSDDSGDKRLGLPQTIPVELEIPETILTSFSETELKFRADAGPGTYPADRDIEIELSTNAHLWRVDYRASDLVGEEGDVRIERMSWERLDRFGRVQDRGGVGADEAVVSGVGPIENLQVRLRFKIQITMEDPAGEYGGTISLVGLTDQ